MYYNSRTKLLWLPVFLTLFIACNTAENSANLSEKKIDIDVVETLSAWTDTPRIRIENWVLAVTDSANTDFIPVADRIAVFDNDGTLWSEQPAPFQALFAFDKLKSLAQTHPEFQNDPVLKGIIDGDLEPLKKAGKAGVLKLVNVTHNAEPEAVFKQSVRNWIDTAHDKRFGKLYKENVFLPMLQLLDYLRAHQFKTFIVSGGGADFMRVWAEEVYGIPPYQVVGSYSKAEYAVVDGKPVVTKAAGDLFFDDEEAKPVAIHRFIGKVPVFCGGNSDGDQAMMQYTSGSPYKSLCVLLHHTDAEREYQYDLHTLSGHLEKALVEAKEKNWLVVDMKNDFKKIFGFQ